MDTRTANPDTGHPHAGNPGTAQWPWIVAIWSGIGLIDACETVFPMRAQGMHHNWIALFFTLFVEFVPWMLATPLVLRLGRHFPPTRTSGLSTWGLHVAVAICIGLVLSVWYVSLVMWLNPWAVDPRARGAFSVLLLEKFSSSVTTSLVLYAFVLVIDYALQSRQRIARQKTEAAQLGEQLSRAQLDALRRQIEPHFMFNALNSIAGLVRDNRNDDAVEMIVALSDFLRHAATDSTRPQVPLAQEVEHLRQYLEIQKARFAERLQVILTIPAELLNAQVPSLILQPLVENAIKHGIAKRAQGGEIQVAATQANGVLNLRVGNDGPCLPAEMEKKRTGIGIANLRNRLQLMYGNGFELSLQNQATGGVEVSISLPLVGA